MQRSLCQSEALETLESVILDGKRGRGISPKAILSHDLDVEFHWLYKRESMFSTSIRTCSAELKVRFHRTRDVYLSGTKNIPL